MVNGDRTVAIPAVKDVITSVIRLMVAALVNQDGLEVSVNHVSNFVLHIKNHSNFETLNA